MANFTDLNLDPNVQESTGSATVVPAGQYKVVLVADELADNKNKTGKLLRLKLQIIEGQFQGEILKDALNLTNPSKQCQAIGQGTLLRICNLTSIPYPPADTAGMMGKPITIKVAVEEFTSDQGNVIKTNKIKAYAEVTANVPQQEPGQNQATGPAPIDNNW